MVRTILMSGVMLLAIATARAQHFQDRITKELTFEKKSPGNALIVANLNGHIRVEGYEGDAIVLEVDRSVSAKTEARLEKGKSEVALGVIDRADTIVLYVRDGCNSFRKRSSPTEHNGWFEGRWGYQWNCAGSDCNLEYDYTMNFTIRVPFSLHVMLSTVNEGDIEVENVKGAVNAHNINGSIRLTQLEREATASTINGDVEVEYSANPAHACRFYSLNGDINALFEKGLAASMSFESFNGSFYTNINDLQPLPVQVVQTAAGDGIRFRVTGNRYRIGKGSDAFLDFETFNGNVYLKEKSD